MLQEKLETIRSEKRRASREMQSNQQTLEKLESVREDLHRRKSATDVEVSDGRMNSVINQIAESEQLIEDLSKKIGDTSVDKEMISKIRIELNAMKEHEDYENQVAEIKQEMV